MATSKRRRASTPPAAALKAAIVRVGDGRGFLVEPFHAGYPARVITAAHCLPHLPPAHAGSYEQDRTYHRLIGAIGDEPSISAQCLFVDPVADVAVLDAPDNQTYEHEPDAYEEFMHARPTLRLGAIRRMRVGPIRRPAPAFMLALDGGWRACALDLERSGRHLTISGASSQAGMSGSPIITRGGRAIGVVCVGGEANGVPADLEHGQPALVGVLPGWLLAELFPQFLETWQAMKRAEERRLKKLWHEGKRLARLVK